MLSDVWHCLNKSSLIPTTNYPTKVLPILDSSVSALGALVNLFTALTIFVRCKRMGTFPTSSIFYSNVCLVNFVECANSIVIHNSAKFEAGHSKSDVNYFLNISSGVQDAVHFCRLALFLPIYLTRLLAIVKPLMFSTHTAGRKKWEGLLCIIIWMTGIIVGGFRCFLRIEKVDGKYLSSAVTSRISFWLVMVTVIFYSCSFIISLLTIIVILKILYQNRCPPDCYHSNLEQENPLDHTGFQVIDKKNVIFESAKSALKLMLAFTAIDVIFNVYLNILSFSVLKIYLSEPCLPAIFVNIRNFLSTTSNFVYSYHFLGVLHGMCICGVLLGQKTMLQTIKFGARCVGLTGSSAAMVLYREAEPYSNVAYSNGPYSTVPYSSGPHNSSPQFD